MTLENSKFDAGAPLENSARNAGFGLLFSVEIIMILTLCSHCSCKKFTFQPFFNFIQPNYQRSREPRAFVYFFTKRVERYQTWRCEYRQNQYKTAKSTCFSPVCKVFPSYFESRNSFIFSAFSNICRVTKYSQNLPNSARFQSYFKAFLDLTLKFIFYFPI